MPKQPITKVEGKPASTMKPLKKAKRDAEDDVDIKVNSKKQKTELIPKKKAQPKKVETSSSDLSDSEEEHKTKKVVAKKPLPKMKDDSTSEDESSDEEPAPVKKQPETIKKAKAESSSSEDDSSSDEEPVPTKKQPAVVKKSKGEISSSEDESSSDEEPIPAKKPVVFNKGKGKTNSSKDKSSSDEEPAPPKQPAAVKKSKSKAKSSSSEDESSSDEEPGVVVKAKAESSSSEDESSSDEETTTVKKQTTTLKVAKVDNSSSEDESSSDEETAPLKKQPAVVKNVENVKPAAKDSSSSEDESEDEKESDDEKPPKKKAKVSSATKTSKQESSSDDSSEESEDEKVTPKKKDPDTEMVQVEQKSNAKQLKTPTTPFQGESKTLYAGNLSFQIERSDIENFFKEAGEVVDVRFASYEDGSFKGFGHVEFSSSEAARKALKLKGKTLLGREIRLDVAVERGAYNTPRSSNVKGAGSQSKTVFVAGLDSSLGEHEMKVALRDHFSGCGDITRIAVPTNWDTGAIKGIAYIDLKDGIHKALKLSGSEMGGWKIVVKEDRPRVESGDGVGRFSDVRGHGRDNGGRDGVGRFSKRRGRGRERDGRFSGGRDRGGRTSQKPSVIDSAQDLFLLS